MANKDTFQKWVEDGEADSQLALIQSLSMQGYSREEIAKSLGIGQRTLYDLAKRHTAVSAAIKSGRRSVVALLQRKLMDKVSEGDTTAIIYGLKVYGGDFFNDRQTLKAEVTGSNGGAIGVSLGPQIYLPKKDELEEEDDE